MLITGWVWLYITTLTILMQVIWSTIDMPLSDLCGIRRFRRNSSLTSSFVDNIYIYMIYVLFCMNAHLDFLSYIDIHIAAIFLKV